MDEFDDILGDALPEKPRRGRPKGASNRPKNHDALRLKAKSPTQVMSLDNVYGGVAVDWLCKVFSMSRKNVAEALRHCPVLRYHQNGGAYYDLKVAAAYLVKPERELADVLGSLKADDLPEKLRESFWNAKIKEMKYRALAGELWPTEAVMEIFSDTFQLIASKSKLWVDDLEEMSELSDKQRKALTDMVDALMVELKEALVSRAKTQQTGSYLAEMDE